MNDNISKLKQDLSALLDKTEDKDTIQLITNINTTVAAIEKDNQDFSGKYGELLGAYKEVIKHTSFIPSTPNVNTGSATPEEKSLSDIIKDTLSAR